MKKYSLLALMAIALMACSNSKTPNSLSSDGLCGPVKLVTSVCYEPIVTSEKIVKGNAAFVRDYWMPLHSACSSEYDEGGNLVSATTYDNQGVVIEVSKYEYKDNDCVGTRIYDGDGELSYSWQIVFADGKAVDYEAYNRDGKDEGETIEYEFEGNHVKTQSYYLYDRLTQTEQYIYQNGKLVLAITTTADGVERFRYEQQWTGSGQLKSRRAIQNGAEGLWEEFTYNDNLQPIAYVRYGSWSNGNMRYTFEYLSSDTHGNWLTRVIYRDSKPYVLEERTIEYY